MPPKRKASEQSTAAGDIAMKKYRFATKGAVSALIPVEERKMAKRGVVEPEMLRMLCEDRAKNNERKEMHFKKLVHADIDWDSKEHIDKINAWRNQIYGRAGIKNKTVLMWHMDEEAWLELFHQLLIVEANKRGFESPKPRIIREMFNEFFVDKVLLTPAGELDPRTERSAGPFTSKLGRIARTLRPYLQEKLHGKNGNTFVPKIDQETIEGYQKLKSDLAKLGCDDEKIIPWEEVEDEANNKAYVVRCREFIASLSGQDDVKMKDDDEEDATLVGSEGLDEELLELAKEPEEDEVRRTNTNKAAITPRKILRPKSVANKSKATKGMQAHTTVYRDLTDLVVDIASSHKKRTDSVTSSNTSEKENSGNLALSGDEVIADKNKG